MAVARAVAAIALVVLGATHSGCAVTVTGTVYVDRNGDRIRQADEPGVPHAVVALDRTAFVRADAEGRYQLDVETGPGVVWVSVPDGFRPGAVWRRVGPGELDLGVIPLTLEEAASPLTFVVAADSHTTNNPADPWDGGDLAEALEQATALAAPPRFVTIVGDITQGNRLEEFDRVEAAVAELRIPWIAVAGNHDWYDGGANWRARWGPDNYSFDVGQLHVVVWDTNLPETDQLAFFTADLAMVPPDRIVVGLGHASPPDPVAEQLVDLGVDYLFTGHWHANRRVERAGLVEWGTQTFLMGSIDQSPAGYRIVTFTGGVPTVEHRARLVEPHLAVTSPHPGSCASPSGFELIVAAALDAAVPDVRARIDCGPEMELAPRGGWAFAGRVPALTPGTHSISLRAEAPSGSRLETQVAIEVCPAEAGAPRTADWPQLGGGPAHTGATPLPIAPPLQQRWAAAVGGNVVLGSPVVSAGTVVVSVTDLGSGDAGGLVALDLLTGTERWRYTTPFPVRNAPAIEGDSVVVALGNGEVHAVSLGDGARRWAYDAADGLPTFESSLWAAPTIDAGVVYVAVQGRMSAIDLATGQARWVQELTPVYPWLGTLAAVTVAEGAAVATYSRDDGMTAWSPTTGARLWNLNTAASVAVNATPVAADGTLFIVNAMGTVAALDLATSSQHWSTSATPGGFEWGYSVTAAPALADGRLFVPTQWKDLVALDAENGVELWRSATARGPLNFAHYRSGEPGFPASPVVTGDVVWVPGPDGTLAALSAVDGHELWSTDLGAPVVSAPAPAGDYLVVATFDGTVRALAPAPAITPGGVPACAPVPEPPRAGDAGCCGARGATGPDGTLIVTVAMTGLLLLRRRQRGSRSRSR